MQLLILMQAFDLFDADGSGSIDLNEMRIAMKALGFNQTKEEVRRMVAEVDDDGSHSIEFGEFLKLMTKTAEKKEPKQVGMGAGVGMGNGN